MKLNILLIDDDFVDVLNIERALIRSDLNYTLVVASDGIQAMEMLTSKLIDTPTPDLILLDLNMPRMNGIEFLKKLRNIEELNKINVVVMTTSSDPNDITSAHQFGILGYIVKSLSSQKLSEEIAVLKNYFNLRSIVNM